MKKFQNFLSENFHCLVVKFSLYLNRHVFVMYNAADMCIQPNYCTYPYKCIQPNYRTHPYKRTVKQFCRLQIAVQIILSTSL